MSETILYGVDWEDGRKLEIDQAKARIRAIVAQEIVLAKDKAHYRDVIKEAQARLDVFYAQKETSPK